MRDISVDNYVAELALFLGNAYKRTKMIYDTDNIRMAIKAVVEAETVSDGLIVSLVNAAQKSGVISFQDHRGMCYILPGNAPAKGKTVVEAFGGPWRNKPAPTNSIKEKMEEKDTAPRFRYENGHRVWSV
jgi:hypothetical protein